MFRRLVSVFTTKCWVNTKYLQIRHIEVSIVGAGNRIGSNLALLLTQNPKITKLNIYDDDDRVRGIGLELAYMSQGPKVVSYAGDNFLPAAVRYANLIVMVARTPRRSGMSRDQMLAANAPAVQKLCKVISEQNCDAFLAISTNPINSIVPFASALMLQYSTYNPFKICGITHIDTARCRSFAGNALNVSPRRLQIPVICGHSEETIVPLFSNLAPSTFSLDSCKSDTLTRLLRKAGTEVINHKYGEESAVLCMAWSIGEFVERMVEALSGYESVVTCFSANPHFGTRFFAGPTMVGPRGIIHVCGNLPMSEYETSLLNRSIPVLNKEVCSGENYINIMNEAGGLKRT
ncbi:uncharacterized protein LOC114352942 [Ostrinia furnacalis]|uniref:uncharacterized protein LOC114352942 n=1 Tax=Ostrinia furnacalis TaxID=93504 RepID=UPI001039178C|nr:uncharacterized protein LOC114352942 [Ostrinia furnacalis]